MDHFGQFVRDINDYLEECEERVDGHFVEQKEQLDKDLKDLVKLHSTRDFALRLNSDKDGLSSTDSQVIKDKSR